MAGALETLETLEIWRGARGWQLQRVCIRTDAELGREQSDKHALPCVRLALVPLSLALAGVRCGLWMVDGGWWLVDG